MINKETYKRLTRRNQKGFPTYNCSDEDIKDCELYYNCGECYKSTQVIKRLAELEDKIIDGTLIELLYKAGDTAIAIIDTLAYNNSVQRVKIKGLAYIVEDENGDTTFQHISRIFPNEKEAEATLKELQENKK